MIKTRRWKRDSKRETEKEKRKGRKQRDTRELSFYGSLVNYRPYNQSVPRYYPQRRKTEKERQNRRTEARERERVKERTIQREGFEAPRSRANSLPVFR